jgi:hypothetical protein
MYLDCNSIVDTIPCRHYSAYPSKLPRCRLPQQLMLLRWKSDACLIKELTASTPAVTSFQGENLTVHFAGDFRRLHCPFDGCSAVLAASGMARSVLKVHLRKVHLVDVAVVYSHY